MLLGKLMDHTQYPKSLKKKSNEALRFIIKDAGEAIKAYPEGENAGFYADEINYCSSELKNRQGKVRNMYHVRYYPDPLAYSVSVGFKSRLLPYRRACDVVRWLKSRGVEAFHDKFQIRD